MTQSVAEQLARKYWEQQMAVWPEGGRLSWEEARPENRAAMLRNVRELLLVMRSPSDRMVDNALHVSGVTRGLAERTWAYMHDAALDEVAKALPA